MTNEIATPCDCCGIETPVVDARVPDDVAEYIRELRRQARPIEAVTELKRLAGFSLSEAMFWCNHCDYGVGRSTQTGPCPYCGKELRTFAAKQCRHCKRDWHDPSELKSL